MSKGSNRRKQQINDKEFEAEWNRIFRRNEDSVYHGEMSEIMSELAKKMKEREEKE